MQGFRTILVAWVSGVLSPWLVENAGFTLSDQQQTIVVGLIMAGVMTAMRVITKSPIFKKQEDKNVP